MESNHIKSVTVSLLAPEPENIRAIHQFIKAHLRTLEEINAIGITGTVEVKFKIEDDGSLTNFKVIKSLSPETDAEALRVIKLLPKRQPLPLQEGSTIINGRSATIPVNFPYKSPFED
jgi:TonB family protein